MRWFWSKRKKEQPADANREPAGAALAVAPRERRRGARQVAPAEPKDALLRFARDYLLAAGARVRIEDEEVLAATLADGATVRYTTSLARARADDATAYLAEGSAALASMLEQSAQHARLVALTLPAAGQADTMALAALADPTPGCGRCLSGTSAAPRADTSATSEPHGIPSCATCPLREGRLLLAGLTGTRRAVVVRTWEARDLELTYLVVGRNRQGRHDEWLRIAVDGSVDGAHRRREPLSAAALERVQASALAPEDAATLDAALPTAQRALTPALEAAALFLRQRTQEEYRRRVEETEATHRRLRGEDPDRAREIDALRTRELAALAEVYAVEMDVRLEGVCVISSPMAEVRVRGAHGGEMLLTVDLGRGIALAPACAICGAEARAGSVCAHGHVTCTAHGRQPDSTGCAACAMPADVGHPPAPRKSAPATPASLAPQPADALTLTRLEALLPGAWRECAAWLLECESYALDMPTPHEDMLVWRGRLEEDPIVACALRLPTGWLLGVEDVRRAAAHAASAPASRIVLLSTAAAPEDAAREAARLGMTLYARPALEAQLARLATADQREREQIREDRQERADAASATRKALLAALKATETTLAKPSKAKPATTRAAVGTAASEVTSARQEAARALLAWETLTADWLACFEERPARDGALQITAEASHFAALSERAGHLREAMTQAIQPLQRAPAEGELGYTVWRQEVIEELASRCEALLLRIQMLDPTRWQDFTKARDLEAEAAAARALATAERAAARAEHGYAQLAERTGLAK